MEQRSVMNWRCQRCKRRWQAFVESPAQTEFYHKVRVCEECAIKPLWWEPKKEPQNER